MCPAQGLVYSSFFFHVGKYILITVLLFSHNEIYKSKTIATYWDIWSDNWKFHEFSDRQYESSHLDLGQTRRPGFLKCGSQPECSVCQEELVRMGRSFGASFQNQLFRCSSKPAKSPSWHEVVNLHASLAPAERNWGWGLGGHQISCQPRDSSYPFLQALFLVFQAC